VKAITCQPLAVLMKEMLLDPLRMERSSFGWQQRLHGNFAMGHSPGGRIALSGNGAYVDATEEERAQRERDYPEYKLASASAGLYTTAADHGRFLAAMLNAEGPMWNWDAEAGDMNHGSHWGDWGFYRNFVIGTRSEKAGS
jgi:CubicO group peptidase (beta-lactamase class C family)